MNKIVSGDEGATITLKEHTGTVAYVLCAAASSYLAVRRDNNFPGFRIHTRHGIFHQAKCCLVASVNCSSNSAVLPCVPLPPVFVAVLLRFACH